MKKRYVLMVGIALLTLLLSGCPAFMDFFGGDGDDDGQDDQVPDLVFVVIDFSVDAATGAVSGVDFTIENGGGADVVDATYRLALSTNAVIDSNDTVVYESQISVVAGGQKTISLTDEIGDYVIDNGISVPVAEYYAGLLLDPENEFAELDETNNNGASANTQLVGDDGSGGDSSTLDYMTPAAQAEVSGSNIAGFDMGVNYTDLGSTYESDVQLYNNPAPVGIENGYISFDLVDTTSSTDVEPGLYTVNPGSSEAYSISWVRILAGDLDTASDTFDYVARFEDESTASTFEYYNWLVYDQITGGTVNVTEDSGEYTFEWSLQTARGTTLSGSHTGTPW